jgi:hypothetical protein
MTRQTVLSLTFSSAVFLSACGGSREVPVAETSGTDFEGATTVVTSTVTSDAGQSIAAADTMILGEAQVDSLQKAADGGDAVAAHRLGVHFLFLSNESESLAVYWFAVAAERGHGLAMRAVATRLYKHGGPENCRRAIELMERSATAPIEPSPKDEVRSWLSRIRSDRERCQ